MAGFGFSTTGREVVERFNEHVSGKTILITGASVNGLGAETALSLAHGKPAQLVLLARSAKKVDPVIEEIKKINHAIQASFVPIELDDISSIDKAVEQIKTQHSIARIDIVINNAGIMATPYQKNNAGLESQLATNHVGHFYLTKQLQPLIAAAGDGARIVNLTSDGYMISPFRFDDYNFSDGKSYDRWSGYGQSKTANILFTRYLADKLAHVGVSSFCVHPGVIMTTSLGTHVEHSEFGEIPAIAERNTGQTFTVGQPKNSQQGVSTTLVAALDPALVKETGAYLTDCNVEPLREYAASSANAEKLWKLSEQLIGAEWDLTQWK